MDYFKDVLMMILFFVIVIALFIASHIIGFILALVFIVYIMYEIYKEGKDDYL